MGLAMPTPLPAVAPSSCWCCLSRRSIPFLLRFLLLLYIGRQPAQDCFGGCGTAATDTGDTGTAPTGGFNPTLQGLRFFQADRRWRHTACDEPMAAQLLYCLLMGNHTTGGKPEHCMCWPPPLLWEGDDLGRSQRHQCLVTTHLSITMLPDILSGDSSPGYRHIPSEHHSGLQND